MEKKTITRVFQWVHVLSAITIGMAVSGMDEAPLRTIFWSVVAFFVLVWSYKVIYKTPLHQPAPPRSTRFQPFDQQARDNLNRSDEDF